jgi:hypothetical protein
MTGIDAPYEAPPRNAHVARLLAESGTLALVSLLSPYARDREAAAALHARGSPTHWRIGLWRSVRR